MLQHLLGGRELKFPDAVLRIRTGLFRDFQSTKTVHSDSLNFSFLQEMT